MIDLNLERKKMELKKVEAALAEMEFKKLERMSDIKRIEKNILLQKEKIQQLKEELGE